MQSKTFSDRDCESIQQVYGNIIESYYENANPQVQAQLLWLNTLFTQTISFPNQLKTQQIISRLQPLKIKARANQNLKNSIISTIQHFGKPINQKLRAQTIEECLKIKRLYQITCLVIQRLGKTKIKDLELQDIDKIFQCLLSSNTNLLIMVETMVSIMNNKPDITSNSKIVEASNYLFENYFRQSLKKKQNALKCLKILLKASKFQSKLIHGRENLLAQAIYQQSPIIIRIQELLNICYEESFCTHFLENISDISNLDPIYVWSYCSVFCVKFTEDNLKTLQSFLNEKIDAEAQYKIYAILNNLVTVNDFTINQSWNPPRNQTEKVINGYLTLLLNVLNHSHSVNKNFNVLAIQKICSQNNYNTEVTKNLLKNLKEAIRGVFHIPSSAPQQKGGKPDKNINYLDLYFARANKIPRSDQDLKYTHEILALELPEDEIERDNIFSLKNQAFQSLRIALIDLQCIYFSKIFNFLDWKCYDYDTFKKLIQLMGYELRINPQSVKAIDFVALADTILQIEEKYKDVLNYLLLGELFESYLDESEWNTEEMRGKSRQQIRIRVLELIKILKVSGRLEKKITNFEDVMQKISSRQEQKNIQRIEEIKKQQNENRDQEVKPNDQAQSGKQVQLQNESKQINKQTQIIINPTPVKQENEQQFIIQIQKTAVQNPTQSEYEAPNRQTKSSAKTQIQDIQKPIIETKTQQNPQTKTQIPQRNSQPTKSKQPLPQIYTKIVFKNIIQKYKIKDGVKRWLKKSKKSKQRFFNIREWADTEKLYMEKLLTIRDKLQIPLINCDLINELEANIIFPNLQAMIRLCQQMYKKLIQIIKSWSPIHTHLAPFLKSITNFLKIYKDFSFNYNKSIDMMRKLSQKPKFIENIKLSKLELENLMFSPVQRFQKYHLFVSTYLRSLPKEHKDYKPLQEQLNHLLKVTDQINEFIQLQDKSKKMIEIEQKFGNVVSNARQYKFEFSAYNFETRCKVYVFNDLIIVAKFREEKYEQELLRMKLCSKSFVRRQQDCQSYRNRLYICGVDWSVHLNFGARADVDTVYNLLKKIVDNIFQNEYNRLDMINQNVSKLKMTSLRMTKNQIDTQVLQNNTYRRLQLSTEVLGVQKININGNLKTYFVLKYQIPKPFEIYQISLLPLDVVQIIEQHLQKLYPKTRLPTTQLKSRQSNLELSKVTQILSVLIQRFLNFILRNKTIAQKPEFLLFQLGIDESIWSYLKTPSNQLQCSCQVCLRANVFVDMSYYDKQKELIGAFKQKFCVINSFTTQNTIATMVNKKMYLDLSIEKKLILALCSMRKIDHRLQKATSFGKKYIFPLHFRNLTDDIVFQARNSTIYSRSRQVIEDICKRLGLSTSLDLRLVLTQDDEQFIIEDDELIYKYAKILNDFQEMERKNQQSFRFTIFQRLSIGKQQSNKRSKKLTLCLRKIFFFDYLQEIKQCQTNPQRYNLLIGEILSKFRSHRFYLSNEERILLCGLLYSIEEFSTLDVEKKVFLKEDKLRKFLPQSDWHVLTKQFTKQVVSLVENQVKSVKNVTVLQKYFIKQFWKKCSYQYFKLLVTSSNNNIFGNMKVIIIGVNSKKVSLLYKEGAPPLREYPISDFNYHIYGQNLYIDIEEVSSSLKGMNLFGLDNIIKTYKCLFQFQNKNMED